MKKRFPGARPEGGPPVHDFTNQNTRLLDDARIRSGIPLGQQFGLKVEPTLQPVIVVNPDAAPLPSNFGWVPQSVPAAIGFRSEIVVSGQLTDSNNILETYFTVIPPAAGTTFEVIMGAVIAGATRGFAPSSDNRRSKLWTGDTVGIVFVGFKNSAAATAGGLRLGNSGLNVLLPTRLGPFYHDPSQPGANAAAAYIVRPAADNASLQLLVEWRQLQRVPS